MTRLKLRVIGRRVRVPVRMCKPGIVPRSSVDRHGPDVHKCPNCAAPVVVEPLMNGKVRVVPHERLPSFAVRTITAVTR